ncbi:MAG: hypothetical protein JSW58_00180 [Candidatus Latescibacterota bacterium]|nr:MAG: hypothetical protein JSW58_00180 [Candidatus Latescibacterota bacterium]
MSVFALALIIPQFFVAGGDTSAIDTGCLSGVVWEWVESLDPYDGGTVYKPDSLSAGHTFQFAEDGTFVEDYPGGCCRYEGEWTLGEDPTQLTLDYTDERRDGDRIVYHIRELSADVLKLGIRGRHGVVIETYKPSENDAGKE